MRSLEIPFALSLLAAPLLAQTPQPKMGAPLHGLTATELQQFDDGRVDFSTVLTPANGLGPIFNQTNCASCHNNPIGGPGSITVTRFGFDDGKGGFDPLVGLGGTLLQQGAINPAAQEVIPAAANITSLRVTPSVLGGGLIEAIDDADIAANETAQASMAISGRVHWVEFIEGPALPLHAGRFGWKAQLASLLSFSADASQNELGLTNRFLQTENAPNGNASLLATYDLVADPEDGPDGNGLDFIDRVTHFQRRLAAPPQTPRSGMTGEALFNSVGCAECHVAQYTTRNDPALEDAIRNQVIRPYSDFLLHDMGVAADFIPDGAATGQELKTPPLWGVRTRDPLWHDARIAGGTLETRMLGAGGVIAQHNALGSEAQPSAQAFLALTGPQQLQVVAFLDSLGRREFDSNGDNVLDEVDAIAFSLARNGGPYTADDPEAVFDINQDGDVDAADLAIFATVYEGDCNNNSINDLDEVVNLGGIDFNNNLVLDICEFCQTDLGFEGAGSLRLDVCGDDLTTAGSRASFQLSGGPGNSMVLIAIGFVPNPTPITATEILVPLEPLAFLVEGFMTTPNGLLILPLWGGANAPIIPFVFQAATYDMSSSTWDLSNGVQVTVGGF